MPAFCRWVRPSDLWWTYFGSMRNFLIFVFAGRISGLPTEGGQATAPRVGTHGERLPGASERTESLQRRRRPLRQVLWASVDAAIAYGTRRESIGLTPHRRVRWTVATVMTELFSYAKEKKGGAASSRYETGLAKPVAQSAKNRVSAERLLLGGDAAGM